MANEEIEISELEYTEEVAPDNLIPIESATDTKATSLQVLRDWFKSFFVSKTGDETISGLKTFQADIVCKKSTHDFSKLPTRSYFTEIRNVDTNDFEIGQFRVWKDTDGANVIDLLGRYQHGTANFYGARLGVKTYADGTSFPYADANDIMNSIVTTTGINKSENGYVKLGNGIIIQWGRGFMNNSKLTTFSFAKAFSSANSYSIAQSYWSPESNRQDPLTMTANTAAGFTIRNTAGSGTNYCFWVAIGY